MIEGDNPSVEIDSELLVFCQLEFSRTVVCLDLERGAVFLVVADGLCRSDQIDGSPLDIGGGHFLDIKRPEVMQMLFRFLPESEWQRFNRVTKIRIRGGELDYPLEANLWQL